MVTPRYLWSLTPRMYSTHGRRSTALRERVYRRDGGHASHDQLGETAIMQTRRGRRHARARPHSERRSYPGCCMPTCGPRRTSLARSAGISLGGVALDLVSLTLTLLGLG